ncbi:tryptophan 7-halogenase [Pseudomaricurvus alcaniphilus]|uniref:tryptophan halogenase family protein n=1 Tax=Pseudomaricurvus alcaniphilus TaxID=1166482 RepID=UPI0014094A1C|nr:tryptophan halogenase family protein [Pseudomaricurvus alcaniphilus]NHN37349.1 tryptophan 7-halogenase [Pseudomaricurvus alcaniphilus]
MSQAPHRIVILGGGTAGWMAANLFANKWREEQVSISLVESPDVGIIGVGEGSTPTLKRFFQMLDIDDKEWMPRCNATYKVNIRFEGWSPASGRQSYSHPFISQLDGFTQNDFIMNCLNRRHGLNVHTQPDDFFINGVLAQQLKGPQTPANFPFRMEYGYHFDSGMLGKYLAERAVEQGVEHIQTRIVDVEKAASGDIAALTNAAGEKIEGDFFIDCSGFASVLMQKALRVKFNSYKDNLFNDAAVVMPTPITANVPVETLSCALSNGWCWKIPLTNRYGNGYVYSSDFISADAAETELRTVLGSLESEQPARHLKMKVGQLEKHWHRNCLGLGLSQGFIEPLEATALHLVQICIELFIGIYEREKFTAAGRDEFNNKMTGRFERVRDYIVAHYKLNTRDDSEYWKANRDNKVLSDSLLHILDTWFRIGDVSKEIERQKIESNFNSLSWHCLLSGYGAYPPLVQKQLDKVDFFKDHKVEQFLQGCSLNFSSHQENLANVR